MKHALQAVESDFGATASWQQSRGSNIEWSENLQRCNNSLTLMHHRNNAAMADTTLSSLYVLSRSLLDVIGEIHSCSCILTEATAKVVVSYERTGPVQVVACISQYYMQQYVLSRCTPRLVARRSKGLCPASTSSSTAHP